MRRVFALIAVIFAFSACAGATTAHAHRYVSTPLVVLNHVDADNVPIRVVVKVQRGQVDLGEGIVMPCGPHFGIPVSSPVLPMGPDCALPETELVPLQAAWPELVPRRPPKSA